MSRVHTIDDDWYARTQVLGSDLTRYVIGHSPSSDRIPDQSTANHRASYHISPKVRSLQPSSKEPCNRGLASTGSAGQNKQHCHGAGRHRASMDRWLRVRPTATVFTPVTIRFRDREQGSMRRRR